MGVTGLAERVGEVNGVQMSRKLVAECMGTYFLVFMVTGAIVFNTFTHHLSPAWMAMLSGMVVMVLVYSFNHISGAHFNPVVTFSFYLLGEIRLRTLFLYIASQLCGAFAASWTLRLAVGNVAHLGATQPAFTWQQAFLFELLLTFWLLFVIFFSSVHGQAIKSFSGLAVGATVALEALLGGPISGASMNPARSLAPAIVSGELQSLWIYLVATFAGATAASILYRYLYVQSPDK